MRSSRAVVLTTERLTLERLETGDLDMLYTLLSNGEVHRYFPGALSFEESRVMLDNILTRYETEGTCFWGVFLKPENTFAGICGIIRQTIDDTVEYEIAYRFLPQFWKQGYATEAAGGCIRHAAEKLNLSSIISLIRPENMPSIAVAKRCGLEYERDILFHEMVHGVYRRRLTTME